jgi:hypothetical protein
VNSDHLILVHQHFSSAGWNVNSSDSAALACGVDGAHMKTRERTSFFLFGNIVYLFVAERRDRRGGLGWAGVWGMHGVRG